MVYLLRQLASGSDPAFVKRRYPILVTSPRLPGLCEENILDAMQRAGLKAVSTPRLTSLQHELSAAYAAAGYGLCDSFANSTQCSLEEQDLPVRDSIVIVYNDDALLTQYSPKREAISSYEPLYYSVADWQAGSTARAAAPNETTHWRRVRNAVLKAPSSGVPPYHVDLVVLTGEDGDDPGPLDAVKAMFYEYQNMVPEIFANDPLTTGARGAAEMAYRAQYDWRKPT